MAVGLDKLPPLPAVPGVRLGVARAGIKKADCRDLVVMALDEASHVAAVFTSNAFCAAPVSLAKTHLAAASPRYLLINTGNANAGTGDRGLQDARACCDALANAVGCRAEEVLPFSTGVIGEPLPVERIAAGLPQAVKALSDDGWVEAAHGIMTTDTVAKGASRQVTLGDRTVTVTGIAKGAGMIRPDMATMLAFLATDASINPELLQRCLSEAVARSFNRITVDGDTSTNDACVLVATGAAGAPSIASADGPDYRVFTKAVAEVCEALAQAIVRDGEGATKFITIEVAGGASSQECLTVAYTVAHSPLVKTAFFASDPNWGRILAAVGRAGIADLDIKTVTIHLGDVCIVRDGGRADDYSEEKGQGIMDRDEITVRIDLARGEVRERIWTCDFSYDYVRINAEYRT